MLDNIKSHATTLSSALTELSQSSRDITKNTSMQSDMSSQASSAMEKITEPFIDVTRNTSSTADFSKNAAARAAEAGKVVNETIEGMDRIAISVKESAATIGALGQRPEQIGDIIKVINDIARQTNLLALNAAIEAARAGEQGRGFAVVADEVRKLAERTSVATQEIGEMIKGIQEDTAKAVDSMEAGTGEVESGVKLADKAGSALGEIVSSISQINDMAQQIAASSEEQSSTGDEVSSNLEAVANISRETAEAVKNSTQSTHDLDVMAQELQNLVSDFRLREGNVSGQVMELDSDEDMNVSSA